MQWHRNKLFYNTRLDSHAIQPDLVTSLVKTEVVLFLADLVAGRPGDSIDATDGDLDRAGGLLREPEPKGFALVHRLAQDKFADRRMKEREAYNKGTAFFDYTLWEHLRVISDVANCEVSHARRE
jgi:hypothetical protein